MAKQIKLTQGRFTWMAQIQNDGKNIYLGLYKELKIAILARKRAEEDYFGEFAYQGGNI